MKERYLQICSVEIDDTLKIGYMNVYPVYKYNAAVDGTRWIEWGYHYQRSGVKILANPKAKYESNGKFDVIHTNFRAKYIRIRIRYS